MRYIFLFIGSLIGCMFTLLMLNHFPWVKLYSINVLKICFTIVLALISGVIALYQVKANVISTARIKWIEEFKKDIAEYSATTHSVIFNYNEYIYAKDEDRRKLYHQKFMEDINQSLAIRSKIIMNLNRKEPYYEEIYQIIIKIATLCKSDNLKHAGEKENYHIIENEFNNLNSVTHQVMKLEWEKAKRMFCVIGYK